MARKRKGGLCPCGSRAPYAACCGRYLDGDVEAESPERLMRTRYAAYAVGDADYLIRTTDPAGEAWEEDEVEWRDSISLFARRCDFRGVTIRASDVGDDEATVEFFARLMRGRIDTSFAELSHFIRRDGRWLYTRGEKVP